MSARFAAVVILLNYRPPRGNAAREIGSTELAMSVEFSYL